MDLRRTFLLGVLALLLATSCARKPPEQALRETIAELGAAVERRDAAALQDHLASDFIGPEGLDQEGARRLAQVWFLRYRDVGATFGPLDVTMQEHHATVRFTAALTGGAGGLLPQAGQLYEVESGWRRAGDDWQLVSVQWTSRLEGSPR